VIATHHIFLQDGRQTPFNQLRETMRWASAFANSEGMPGRVQWLGEDGTCLLLDGKRVDIQDIKAGIKEGMASLKQFLHTDVMFGAPIPRDLNIVDNLRNSMPG